MEKLLKLFAWLRRLLESVTWKLFQPKGWRSLKDIILWEDIKDFSPQKFSTILNQFEYKYDKCYGLLDNTQPVDEPQYFFKELSSDRDCDNWAREWVSYYRYHNKPVQEWIVTNKKHPFTKSHLIAVVNEGNGWRLLNYWRYPDTHVTIDQAIEDIKDFNNGDYSRENRLQCLYKDWSC